MNRKNLEISHDPSDKLLEIMLIFNIYDYSGHDKTVLIHFHEKYPDYIHLITDFTSLSPTQMIVKMGNCVAYP